MRTWGGVWVTVALIGVALTRPPVATGPSVVRVTPHGTVKQVRQATVVFSEAMVALGDPRPTTDPVTVTCPMPGHGRWVDTRTWVFDFDHELPAGLRCVLALAPDRRTLAGRPVATTGPWELSTGGPTVTASVPAEESTIDEDQAFLLRLDGAVDPESVAALAHVVVDGLPDRIPVRVLPPADRDAMIASRRWDASAPAIAVQAVRRLPNGAAIRLRWGAGIRAPSGVATTAPHDLAFTVRKAFTAELTCDHETPRGGCIPLTPIVLRFTAPVAWAQATAVALLDGGGNRRAPDVPTDGDPQVTRLRFAPPFPADTTWRLEIPATLADADGRPLENAGAFPLVVRIDRHPPLAKFAARFGIVEAKADPTLPVTVRHLDADAPATPMAVRGATTRIPTDDVATMLHWLRRVGSMPRERSVLAGAPTTTPFALPAADGADAFQVLGIPLAGPGLHVVELTSVVLGTALLEHPAPLYVPTAVLVTDLAVHVKWARERSLVWVTSLSTGRPVPGARVRVADCRGTVLAGGTTDADGLVWTGPLPEQAGLPVCSDDLPDEGDPFADARDAEVFGGLTTGLTVVADTGDDVGIVHSSWTRGIEAWRFRLPDPRFDGPVVAHTILDRTLFRAGETVHMKHLVREQSLAGFGAVAAATRPSRLVVRHWGSDERYELPLDWLDSGQADSTWTIPPSAKLGVYEITLMTPPAAGEPSWRARERTTTTFRVEEFRVPLLRGTVRLPPVPALAGHAIPADVSVRFLSGGPAAALPAIVRTQVLPYAAMPGAMLDGYAVANGPVREGLRRAGDVDDDAAPDATTMLDRRELVLDATGTGRVDLPVAPARDVPTTLVAELEFRDPNGEAHTTSARTAIWPARVLAAVKARDWAKARGDLRAQVVALDLRGRPAPGVPVRVTAFAERIYSTRKRVVGGFYAYEHVTEVRRVGELCRGTTGTGGTFKCSGRPDVEGDLVLQAEVTDADGTTSAANTHVWVGRGDEWWFAAADHDRMDVLAERRRYEPGETARLQVRMPFRRATALVTLEREGVMHARVVELDARSPLVEVPVEAAHAPNVFVSVLAVRGRVGDVGPTALVDLGRPAFKLGIAELRVGWSPHELAVRVEPERDTYRVRERAMARVHVRTPDGGLPPPGTEVAIAAVDEGLLELAPNGTWNVLDAMMAPRGYGVTTASAQMQVIGKRHYGRKALPAGGSGGRGATRELFDTLLTWQPHVPLDADGRATVEIPLNDALTSVRIVAVATGAQDRFGTGAASIRTTQDLMLFSGIPPLAREGDRLRAELTVRNATTRPLTVAVRGGVADGGISLEPRTLALAAGESRVADWGVTIPSGASVLTWAFEAGEPGGAVDRLRVTQQMRPAVPERTLAASLVQVRDTATLPVAPPRDALAGRSTLRVGLAPTLAVGLEGVRDWMRRYPYRCLEQRMSRAIVLGEPALRDETLAALASHLDGHGLLKFFPTSQTGSEVLTAYVLAAARAAGWTLPASIVERTTTGLAAFVDGRYVPSAPRAGTDLVLRKLQALAALSAYRTIEPRQLGTFVVEPALWPTSAVLDWWTILRALPAAPDRARRLREVEQIVRSRLDASGTTLRFSTAATDRLWWLFAGADANLAQLALLVRDEREWRDDLPQLIQGLLALQVRGAWSTTPANAWGTLAVDAFTRTVERGTVTGRTTVTLGDQTRTYGWDGPGVTLDLPLSIAGDLALLHAGDGTPWATVQVRAAIAPTAPIAAGYRITRTMTPLEGAPGEVHRGDRVRIRIEVEAAADMGWVVVDDPVPAGASHLRVDPSGDADEPTFVERAFDAHRAYFASLAQGRHVVEYAIRLDQIGTFQLPPTRVEALYAPEMFGELPNAAVEVR